MPGRPWRFSCDQGRLLLVANHGGAVNEAFSDIVGTAVEFWAHETASGGAGRADYLMGEDTGRTIRSLDAPLAAKGFLNPDHFSGMLWFIVAVFEDTGESHFLPFASVDGRTIVELPGHDLGGEHWNSTILSHAFYLAIEGGRNRTSGRTVQGVGGANRGDVERAFFRAMTDLMPNTVSMPMAADVIRQSAIDLFGFGSPTHNAIAQALDAVGLQ